MYPAFVFVTLEGPEGAGKSSVLREIASRLESEGRSVLATREPGSGEVGTAIRKVLLEGGTLDPKCELFLFLADRAQHVAAVVRPALAQGKIVLCDRHADSTVVYQGVGRGLDPQLLRDWNRFATDGLRPDATILLDVDPEIGLSRVTEANRLDREPLEFHQRIRAAFLDEARREPERWIVVDASQPLDAVVSQAWSALSRRLR